jgi:hypothetical protein
MKHFRRLPITTTGLLLGVLAAVVAMTAAGRPIVTGPARVSTVTLAINLPASVVWVFVAAAVVLLVMASLGAVWAKLVGAAVTFGTAGTAAFMVAIAKTSSRFHHAAVPQLASGGKILAAAFIIGIAGVVAMVVGARELLPPPEERAALRDASGLPVRPGSAGVALGFSLLGVICFPVAPVGVILGLLAYWQIIESEDDVPGRNLALTAIILGTTWISLWTIVVFGAGIWSAHTI